MHRFQLNKIAVFAIVAGLALAPTFAKTEGSLAGIVKDGQGAPLPGVTVTVSSADLIGGSRSTTTDANGNYRFPALPPGNYAIKSELFGFKTFEQDGIQIQINQPASFNPVMGVEGVEIGIEVRAHEDIVQPEKTQVSTALNNEFVDNIPVLGRSYQTLLLLAPGVVNEAGNGTFGGANVNSHGARGNANQYMFDGGNTTDTNLGTFGTNFNQDAVDQIEVITAGYKAEFGRSDGAISNILTKSGGNEFEGSFRFDLRDSSLDKRGSGKQAFQDQDFYRRYYSATLGGPFVKDRFWFFLSLYYQDRKQVSQYEGGAYPVQDRPAEFWDYFAKLTYQINDDHQLLFSFHFDPATIHNAYSNGDFPPEHRTEQHQEGKFYLVKESAVFTPNVFLESLVYVTDGQVLEIGPDSDAPSSSFPYPGYDQSTGAYVGANNFIVATNRDRNQFREDLSIFIDDAMGTHDMKIGVNYELEFANETDVTFPDYILENGVPVEKHFSPNDPRFSPTAASHARIFSAYLQDSWSPKPGLTFNLGVRADYEEVEFNGFSGSDQVFVDPTFTPEDARVIVDSVSDVGVAPRLGFSWDPQADGKNVIRGSASRFYTTIPGYAGTWDRNAQLSNSLSCDTDPQGNCINTGSIETTLFYLDRDIKMPYTDEFTVGYEREIVPELAIGVTGIYRKGHELFQDTDPNTFYTDEDGDGFAETKNRVNPNFNTLFVLGNNNRSEYKGLEITARKRLSDNWQLLGSYSYSIAKGMGEWGGTADGDDARLIPFEYSYANWDQRHVVKLDGTYFLPLDFIVSASARWQTGTPYSIDVKNFVDLNGNGFPDSGETGSIAGGGNHWIGKRNSQRNDTYFNLDLRAEKAFVFKGVTLGIFGDVFNVLNDQSTVSTGAAMLVYNPNCDPSTSECLPPGTIKKTEEKRFGRQFQLGFRINF